MTTYELIIPAPVALTRPGADLPIALPRLDVVADLDDASRGTGGFGSTGVK